MTKYSIELSTFSSNPDEVEVYIIPTEVEPAENFLLYKYAVIGMVDRSIPILNHSQVFFYLEGGIGVNFLCHRDDVPYIIGGIREYLNTPYEVVRK